MNKGLLLYTGLLTLFTIYTIHKYEDAIKQYKHSISDYKRALNYAKNSPLYDKLKNDYDLLEQEFADTYKAYCDMAAEVKMLKAKLAGDESKIQYESHTYKSNTYDASGYEKIIEL